MKRRQAYAVICALSLFTSVISGVTVMAEPETQAVEQSETADESTEADAEQSGTAESESLEEETEGETEVFIDHPEARISIPYDQPEAWGEIAMTNDDTVETGINLRDKKDEDGTVLGFLYHGCAVWVLNKGEEWSEVYSGGMTGYVKNEYLTFGDEAKGLGEHYGVDGVTASWDGVNVYAAPDGGSEVVKVMNTGDDMVVLEDNGHWLTVKLDAKNKAYVSEDDVVRVLLVDAAMPKDGVYKDEVVEESTEEEYTETEEPQTEAPQTEAPQTEAPQTEPPQTEAPQTEPPQTEAPQTEPPQTEAPQTEPPQTEAPQTEPPQTEPPQTEAPQTEAPQTEPPQTETDDIYYEDPDDTTDPSGSDDDIYYEDPEDGSDDGSDIDGDGYYDEESGEMVGTQDYDSQGTPEEYYDADSETEAYEETEAYVEESGTTDSTVEAYSDGTDTSGETVGETEAYAETSVQETEAASAGTDDAALLASLIYCEAGNQSYEGMVAVGAVVMNRVNDSSYPDTVSDVIYQSGQFTPASSGSLSSALENGVPSTCYDAANAALSGQDPTGGAMYFNTGSGSGTQIGDHQFY